MGKNLKDAIQQAIAADRKQQREVGYALEQYKACGGDEEQDPIERLRFFCSFAMGGQNWLDVEQFFDDIISEREKLKHLANEQALGSPVTAKSNKEMV